MTNHDVIGTGRGLGASHQTGWTALIANVLQQVGEVRERKKNDPWLKQGILKSESIKRWEIFIDERK